MDLLLPANDTHRKIIHLDMDAFYASVEMRDHPEYKKKAVVIAHDPREHNGHGVVATANYLARSYGVHSAQPAIKALKLIPKNELVFVQPNFEKYRDVSAQIHQYMYELTDQVESVALDEAYLDVTNNKLKIDSALRIALKLQNKIYQELHLTSSFGVSYNKFLAKMGSEYAKPLGRTVILPEDSLSFLAKQPIENFPGIGVKSQDEFHQLGIFTGSDLQKLEVYFLITRFKKLGYLIAQHAQGIDLSPVKSKRMSKSIGIERTFDPLIFDDNQALTNLRNYSQILSKKLKDKQFLAKVIVLKIRNNNFVTVTRRLSLEHPTNDSLVIFDTARILFKQENHFLNDGIRLLGLTSSELIVNGYEQTTLELFTSELDSGN